MADPRRNAYDDDDLKQIVERIEEVEDLIVTIMAKAAAEAGAQRKRIKNIKKEAKDVGIPSQPLSALLRTRKYERKIADLADGIDDDYVEIYEDMIGQFSFLIPDASEPETTSASQVAARQRKEATQKAHEAEQAEGAAVLNALTQP